MAEKVWRWGLIGSGKICNDFAGVLTSLPESTVAAVSARDVARAREFGARFGVPEDHCFGSYQELVDCPDIDVVYVGTLHNTHFEHAALALRANKHVLCEKPLTLNAGQARELIALAQERNLFLMEAMWTRAFPAIRRLQQLIEDGVLGEVSMVDASFGFYTDGSVERLVNPDLAGGALLDIGVYTVALTSLVYGKRPPVAVCALGSLNAEGCDDNVGILLKYPTGMGVLCVTLKGSPSCEATIVGSKGSVKLPRPFWCPEKLVLTMQGQEPVVEEYPIPELQWVKDHPDFNFIFEHGDGMQFEVQEVHRCLQLGLKESPLIPHAESITIQNVLDSARQQLGVKYPGEEK